MKRNPSWSAAEDAIVTMYYPLEGNDAAARLPGRTVWGMRIRASKLGVKRHDYETGVPLGMRACSGCRRALPESFFYTNGDRGLNRRCKDCIGKRVGEYAKARHATDQRHRLLRGAKNRARRDGYPCTITVEDIVVPTVCPWLGLVLKPSVGARGRHHDTSPTLEKIVPSLGYVPGNVMVVSFLANSLASNATPRALRMVADGKQRALEQASYDPGERLLLPSPSVTGPPT